MTCKALRMGSCRAETPPDERLGGVSRGQVSRHREPDTTCRRVRNGLRGRFRALSRSFGYSTGRQVENGANQGRESSTYLQGCTICAFCPWIASASVVQKQRGNRRNSRESRSPHNHPHHGFSRAASTQRSPGPWRQATDITGPRDEYAPRLSTKRLVGTRSYTVKVWMGTTLNPGPPFPASCPFRESISSAARTRVLQFMSLPPQTALAATGWSDSCRAVESGAGAVPLGSGVYDPACFRGGAKSDSHRSVSSPCSSNRTCGFPASGSQSGSRLRPRKVPGRPRKAREAVQRQSR